MQVLRLYQVHDQSENLSHSHNDTPSDSVHKKLLKYWIGPDSPISIRDNFPNEMMNFLMAERVVERVHDIETVVKISETADNPLVSPTAI